LRESLGLYLLAEKECVCIEEQWLQTAYIGSEEIFDNCLLFLGVTNDKQMSIDAERFTITLS